MDVGESSPVNMRSYVPKRGAQKVKSCGPRIAEEAESEPPAAVSLDKVLGDESVSVAVCVGVPPNDIALRVDAVCIG